MELDLLPELRIGERRSQATIAVEPDTVVTDGEGHIWAQHYLRVPQPLLRFPGIADFLLPPSGQPINAFPSVDVDDRTVQLLWLNQVVPLLLTRLDGLVLHGCAVCVHGQAVAFLGASGAGKSTLCAFLAANGLPFLSDDILRITRGNAHDKLLVQPSEPLFRLWRDSEEALVAASDAVRLADVSFTTKGQFMSAKSFVHCATPLPLGQIVFLANNGASGVSIDRVEAGEGLIALMGNSFLLDKHLTVAKRIHFENLSNLADKIPVFRLDYPRRYDALDAVRSAVLSSVSQISDNMPAFL